MTGGLTEFFDLQQPPENLLSLMMRAMEMGSLFGCSIEADPNVFEARLPNGLVKVRHFLNSTLSPSVLGARVQHHGNAHSQHAVWAHSSSAHTKPVGQRSGVERRMERQLQGVEEHSRKCQARDGPHVRPRRRVLVCFTRWRRRFTEPECFRMSFDDFMRHFEKMEICNLGPDVMEEVYSMTGVKPTNHTWSTNSHDGSWRRGVNAGGCRNNLSAYHYRHAPSMT